MSETSGPSSGIEVYLVDGTYELFRHHFGRRPAGTTDEFSATRGVLAWILSLLSRGVTHVGVATDHVIESFRNDMWPGYKTSAGVPAELLTQFALLEEALRALGVRIWPMIELEADDAIAAAAAMASADPTVGRVLIASPDKDLAQCVQGEHVVQFESRSGAVSDEEAVVAKFGVRPESIPDWLALVGDSADGFPGLPGWGKVASSTVLSHYGHLEAIPNEAGDWDKAVMSTVRGAQRLATCLASERPLAMLFRDLATLRTHHDDVGTVADLAWAGPTAAFAGLCDSLGIDDLIDRAEATASRRR